MAKIVSPFDHITLIPSDYEEALAFYDAALTPLGIKQVMPKDDSCGYGIDRPFFWLGAPDTGHPPTKNLHLAFSAGSKEEVEAFHAAAFNAGGIDNGTPSYRTQYHAGYYAAFILDPDGNNIEALYREPNGVENAGIITVKKILLSIWTFVSIISILGVVTTGGGFVVSIIPTQGNLYSLYFI